MTNKQIIRRLTLTAMLLVTPAACSKDATPAAGGSTGGPSQATTAPPPAATSPAIPVAAGAIKYYECRALLTDQEVRRATGLSDAAFLKQEHGEAAKGQTYCQFFAGQGISIAVSVLTGPSFTDVFQPLSAAGQGLPEIQGLGDWAKWGDQGTTLGVRVGSTGITIAFANTGGGSLGISDPKGAAIAMAKLIISRL